MADIKPVPLDKSKEVKKIVLPEDEKVGVTEAELKEQLGHQQILLINASKVEAHLRQVIKDLRKELDNGS